MKCLPLLIFFFLLGACSTKSNVFSEADGTTKASNGSSDAQNEGATNEATGETQATNPPDKAIDMSETNNLPEIEGTERVSAICTNKRNSGDVRTISVIDTKEGYCGTVYTKFSKKKTEAYAKVDMNFCEEVHNGIINNLMGIDGRGLFNCAGDIPEAPVEMETTTDGGSGEPTQENNSPSVEGGTEEQSPDENTTDSTGAQDDSNGFQDDKTTVQLMDTSTFLQMRGRERTVLDCKNEDDERTVSVIDTMEGPCGVVHSMTNGEKKLETFSKHDMSKCDDVFNKLVNQLIGQGFDCLGDGSSAED